MTRSNRRDFLRLAAGTAGAAALNLFPPVIRDALAIPANRRTGTIRDIEHIVILMQENRSFDHYFGTLRGVRGFGDPRPLRLASGKSVFHQPVGAAELLPFHPGADKLGMQFLQDLPHGWQDMHAAWNKGRYDQWVPNKGTTTMAYLQRDDIPFHYQLADAFTICDAYHCAIPSSTDPNRYYMWTGYVGNDGTGGGPVLGNEEKGYGWTTYPEVLQQAGVSWKIYQDVGTGLDANGSWGWTQNPYIGNYGDNSLLYFNQYRTALPGTPLYDNARTGTNVSAGGTLFDVLQQDVKNGTLPQVSWICAPEAYSEHPNWPANYGAWYIEQVLKTLVSNPDVWSKTALFITYDENDGFFDHVPPPFAPQSRDNGLSTVATTNEVFAGDASHMAGPYGLGPRVPMLVVSPWTKGGWVCSQTFDHTSLLQFIEARFGAQYAVKAANISPWRRAVCGDLTSAFDFSTPDASWPTLPDTSAYAPPDRNRHPDYIPVPPVLQTVPTQEPGLRPARALPYELFVHGRVEPAAGRFRLNFANTGRAGAAFQVQSRNRVDGPWTYTVEAGKRIADTWSAAPSLGRYDLDVYGPNGFYCHFRGPFASGAGHADANPEAIYGYDVANGNITLRLMNRGHRTVRLTVTNAYGSGAARTFELAPGAHVDDYWDLRGSHGWYDLTVSDGQPLGFLRRFAGHVETGRASTSDPLIRTSASGTGAGAASDALSDASAG
ncbi:phosphocholine-specific phospholipase C [Burkholderia multivorans]|uniref:phosphocholine-specific phospholipase C n=1 Tax=Burkholderia multivorans TaxID=87883 RepID=UPI0020A16F1F|nr:phospholipase C, phosphocholine-specific [Burkholderia multivorans]MCO8587884.1 phospholipase C, phosphocholine-specific [Burkholderia multivorans]MCO8611250.1 phospholipase C, phosphocholine-specific [Burkholderia multivorans]MCO8630404.1 phospholipase C, phosphocholine-specific [Burkholderia multivorans]MCO8636818.1 phospholipase C, phosphocholine-specific [Burkholderia multivorans]